MAGCIRMSGLPQPSPAQHEEGSAKVMVGSSVFFSKHQELQRDMTVLLLQHLQGPTSSPSPKHIRILDALSGCGIRAIRYALEVPLVASVVANDVDADAASSIQQNILRNQVAHVIKPSRMDAIDCMRRTKNGGRYDVIDLDPFGPCASLLASAIATVSTGGLICATDTDMQTLLGKTSHAHAQCHAQYGAVPVTAAYGKELAIRIVVGAAAAMATACDRYIEPVLCTAVEFFVRVHFRVHDLPPQGGCVMPVKLSVVHQCIRCSFFRLRPLGKATGDSRDDGQDSSPTCPVCGGLLQVGGPLWTGPLQDKPTIMSMVANTSAASQSTPAFSVVRSISQEMLGDVDDLVLSISIPKLFRPYKGVVASVPSKFAFLKALTALGYAATSTHLDPTGTKTNAPLLVVYRVVVTWLHAHECLATSPILPSVLPLPTTDLTFPPRDSQNYPVAFAPRIKCLVDHTWHRPVAAQQTRTDDVRGHTWHVYESTFEAVVAVLAQSRAQDCVVLHGHRYVLPSSLHIPSGITVQGRPTAPHTTMVGQIVVKNSSHVTLRHLHIHCPAPLPSAAAPATGIEASKRPARFHPVLIASSFNVQLEQCTISCGRHAPVLACVGIVDGSTNVGLTTCAIHAGPQAGACVAGKSKVVVRDCTIDDVAGCGVDVQSGSEAYVVGTRVANCGKSGLFVHSFASLLLEDSHIDRNGMAAVEVTTQATAILRRNVLSRGKKGGLLVHSSGRVELAEANVVTKNALAGVDVRGVGSVAVIKHNHVCNGRASGVFVSDDGAVYLHDNAILGNKRAGIEAADAVVYRNGHDDASATAGNGIPELGDTRQPSARLEHG
ncbi:N2,N2-dimethylguanosine tRNA methyltransferase, variant 1 [Aphanomyces invadans]|uniref:tRNA (guanine(26)-N(2))-dimethyltransferase n=1 Tax=Aphanomyces invadans TaxID=157072 RepID=A0A024U2J7_9STRA|nr:N2,N2-dimethylguanosine tRNA methyltransferase, variant 1 [Aphanomyces invadans]ETW00132.1 N2,N2-dimethylguanosine tRNA methyltransferase, variant 1 [Aphanomyces invadans]|eukprot:XP_008871157.1 N2,N2-dimethylguanosine tRNA methyltransferase, variant 1 [Aphanomyces invadans]